MLKVSVEVNLDELTQSAYQRVSQAVADTAMAGASIWKESVFNAKLSPYDKDAYLKSIQWGMTGNFSAELFTDYRVAGEIETGRPARDMKKNLQTSQLTRISHSKKHAGQKYLIIPFRHNTPGNIAHAAAMPDSVHTEAKQLVKSKVLSMSARTSATGATVPQRNYQWGERLPAGLMPKAKPHHTTDLYAGMVRFDTSAGKSKSSSHLTFRIMAEWQTNSWIIPAQPGLFLAKSTMESLQPILEAAINKAAE